MDSLVALLPYVLFAKKYQKLAPFVFEERKLARGETHPLIGWFHVAFPHSSPLAYAFPSKSDSPFRSAYSNVIIPTTSGYLSFYLGLGWRVGTKKRAALEKKDSPRY